MSRVLLTLATLSGALLTTQMTASAAGTVGSGVTSISAPVLVTVNGGQGFGDRPRNETSIAVDPTNPNNVLGSANDYIVGDSSCGVYWSRDGGKSWADSILPGHQFSVDATLPQPLPTGTGGVRPQVHSRYDLSGDPGVAFDAQGNAYYVCLTANRPEDDGSIFASTALKGTFGFNRPVSIDTGFTPVLFNDKPSITVDPTVGKPSSGNVYVFYTKFLALTGTLILESQSSDQGRTFTKPQLITTLKQASASGTSAGVGPNGEVYVAYENDTNNLSGTMVSEIDVQVSRDGGTSFSAPIKAADDHPVSGQIQHSVGRDNSFPTLVVDSSATSPYSGRVYIAWTDAKDGHADIRFTSSTDGGVTYAAPKKLNDDNPDNVAADHVFPGLAVAPDGFLAADWPIDQRDDPTKGFYHPYYTESLDGGATFRPNVSLAPGQLSDPLNADFQGQFVGDYNGLTADNTAVHPLWVAAGLDQARDGKHEVLFTNIMPRGVAPVPVLSTLPTMVQLASSPLAYVTLVAGAGLWLLTRRRRRRLPRTSLR